MLAALMGWAAAAEAAPGAIVMVLMDRSGSMVNNGQCVQSGTGTAFVDRKWVCGINDARDWVNNQDLTATNEYYFWQLASMPPDFSVMTIKAGPFSKAQMITQLNNFEILGPLVDDAATPLAGAYCEAVDFLKQRRNDLSLPTLPLYLKLESDGLENSTPSGNECQGVDSGSGHAFVAGPITPLPAGGPYTSVNNLLVPSWQSNLFDKTISGVVHNPANPPDAFAPPGASTVIAEITFLENFIPPAMMAARLAPATVGSSGVDGTAGPASGARASLLAPSLLGGPSTTEDYVSFLSGLASASGGRFTRVGSGAPFVPGDPNAPSPQPGDADGSLCVDQADAAILGRWLGKSVTTSDLESYEADVTKDGVIDLNDYTLLKAHYGEGCPTPPAALPPLGYILFGFEDVSLWSSSRAPLSLTGTPHSQGQYALTIGGKGLREVDSAAFDTRLVPADSCKVTLDVATTSMTPPFPVSLRGPQLLVTIPSAGIYNEPLTPVRPRAQPVNGFLTAAYRVVPRLSRALSKPHSDVVIKMFVEGDDSVTVDNLTFAAGCDRDDD